MSRIEEIASVHLGKAGDGTVVKPYITPDTVDSSLLVGVPRVLNRTQYNIQEDALPFVGADTWNCYEFSTLLNNGFPVSGLLRIVYSSDSENIVESKSLKLYLNSFNMMHNGATIDEAVQNVTSRIYEDLHTTLILKDNDDLSVDLHFEDSLGVAPVDGSYDLLENICRVEDMEFTQYNEDPNTLVVVESEVYKPYHSFRSSILRSNCRVTNQPDFGDVFIRIRGSHTVTPESLLQYIVSMRRENHFHEEIAECIYKRLYDLLEPDELFVACLYTRRGGIDINPVRASNQTVLIDNARALINSEVVNVKTMRQ